jgi:hypothetical protein
MRGISSWKVYGFTCPKGKRSIGIYDYRKYGVNAVSVVIWWFGVTALGPSTTFPTELS